MKLFHPALWSSFLFVWVSQCDSEPINVDICEDELVNELIVWGPSIKTQYVHKDRVPETFSCRLYPTNLLGCSWSFHTLQNDTQLSVHISLCGDSGGTVYLWSNSSKQKEGSWSKLLNEDLNAHVVVQFNVSLPDTWKAYVYMFDKDALEVVSPPSNLSTSVKDGDLLVTWDLPVSRTVNRPNCFQYQLDLGDQDKIKNLTNKLSYSELNDPTQTYKVRIRAKIREECQGGPEWSEWSPTVTAEQSVYKLNALVIASISLGIPMILLAVLLLVRHQRISHLLFPPIPRPPPKYIHFLEKSEMPSLFYPAQIEEEITEVEDTEES